MDLSAIFYNCPSVSLVLNTTMAWLILLNVGPTYGFLNYDFADTGCS